MFLLRLLFVFCISSVLASPAATRSDLSRAHRKIPGHSFLGNDLASMNKALNTHLQSKYGQATTPCESFTAADLQDLQREIFHLADAKLLAIYDNVDSDLPSQGRRRTQDLASLEAEWSAASEVIQGDDRLRGIHRDGMCHNTVMWFVHHLSEGSRQELAQRIALPMLPVNAHEAPENPSEAEDHIHNLYDTHTTCQACHTGGIPNQGPMDPPLTPDPDHPGWDRIRRCDAKCTGDRDTGCVQYDPPCGPCDGVGGPYFGDAVAEFVPVNCRVISTPDKVPEKDRQAPLLPKQFRVELQGADRVIRTQNPTGSTLYSNIHGVMYVDEDRDDGVYALRHDTYYERFSALGQGLATEIHTQSQAMMKTNVTGAMFSTIAALKPFSAIKQLGYCTCVPDPVGVPHWDGFKDAQYMGRVLLDPIEYLNRSAIVDHWAKWFFHLFIDADKNSPTHGQVLRFYSPYAGFATYHDWKLVAPESLYPNVWNDTLPEKGPEHCMNPQKVDKLCDSYWPSNDWPSTTAEAYARAESLRFPLFPSAMERLAEMAENGLPEFPLD